MSIIVRKNSKLVRYMQLLIIVLGAGAIYPIIYLRQQYQETILAVFDMSAAQLNTLYSVLGVAFVVGYVPSGILSDKFSAKKLMVISLFGVALGGFWFAQRPSYISVIIIYAIWGTFSVLTFWGSHMKLVKLLSTKEDEGRFFGILDGGRGAVEAILAHIAAVFIFARIIGPEGAANASQSVKESAMLGVVYMYSIFVVIAAILVAIFVKEDSAEERQMIAKSENKFKLSQVREVFKNSMVLLMGSIIFLAYIVTWALYCYNGFLETNVSVDAVTVSDVMVVVLWMRPVGGILGGFIADKIGRTKTLAGALIGNVVCLILMSVLAPTLPKGVFYTIVVVASIFVYAIRGTYWSLFGDCRVDKRLTGTTIGVVSLMGYASDIVLPLIITKLFDSFGPNGGYNAYFIITSVLGLICVASVIIFGYQTKKNGTQQAKIEEPAVAELVAE